MSVGAFILTFVSWTFQWERVKCLLTSVHHHSLEEVSLLQEMNVARVQLKILQEESFLGHSLDTGEQLWASGILFVFKLHLSSKWCCGSRGVLEEPKSLLTFFCIQGWLCSDFLAAICKLGWRRLLVCFAVTCKSRKSGGYWYKLDFGAAGWSIPEVTHQHDDLLLHRAEGEERCLSLTFCSNQSMTLNLPHWARHPVHRV